MHIQLDPLGGMAGDMFLAAMLDAFPGHEAGALASIHAALAGVEVHCRLIEHNDGVFRGRRFEVAADGPPHDHDHHHHHAHDHDHDHDHHDHGHDHHDHSHADWTSIRAQLEAADLNPEVRRHALAIFARLADAEAQVHGVTPDQVRFHEVGAADSIADIVGAAHMIAAVGAQAWTVSDLPLGSGRIRTAHGLMPVPAPATALLLQGFRFIDDGGPGERVTPTGAAILRHLCDPASNANRSSATLSHAGVGFGTRALPGISNCLRVLVFEPQAAPAAWGRRELLVIEFEIDDQSAEDLAIGLERLRAHPAVHDAVQAPVFGKKGRMMTHVRLLARADALDAVAETVFRETTTIGLRHHRVQGAVLERRIDDVVVGGRPVRVKTVDRPGGATAKAEADDALAHETHAGRAALRRDAEQAALDAGDAS